MLGLYRVVGQLSLPALVYRVSGCHAADRALRSSADDWKIRETVKFVFVLIADREILPLLI
jgi:hypothetical protein